MKSKLSAIFLVIFLLINAGYVSAQQGTVEGKVTVDGNPLRGASVSMVGTVRGAITNANGMYRIMTYPGTYTVRASFIGFKTVEKSVAVSPGETVTVNFPLVESVLVTGDELVVLGSRTARTAVETPVPVDVISSLEIRESGETEVNQILRAIAPSFNASHQTIADGTDHINPASLRGLGPDQVLVLINGKRRHSSAVVHVNGTFGRGTVGVDLNAIPKSAIERIEVLRDGASAQYGSDAIAGVINIVLKEQTGHIEVNSLVGQTGEGDGEQTKVDVNYGFKIGSKGFFNITGEYFDRGRTNRSDAFQGSVFFSDKAADDAEIQRLGLTRRDFSMRTGQGQAIVGASFFNAAAPISENAEFYTFGGLSHRNGFATGFYRRPIQEERVVFDIFPNGFLPEIHTEITDAAFTAGLRGTRKGWDVDFSVTTGGSSFQFNIENTNNASLGSASPISFDAGTLKFNQTTGNLDLVKLIDTGGAVKSLSFVFGGEFRVENYQIEAGQFESYSLGNGGDRPGVDFDTTSTGAPKAAGSQVFPGFQPSNEVDRFRNSIAGYAGLETQVSDRFLIDVGGRLENYNDFGKTTDGKVALRYEVAKNVALRGSVSSGFRAPSLHQVWFNNVSTQFIVDPVSGELVPERVLTANNLSSVTKAFGIPRLKEESSTNVSAGFTARPTENFSVTADYYRITIDDRIVLTSRFTASNPTFATILEPFSSLGVSQAQFFANVVDTETNGVDIVGSYAISTARGRVDLTGAANFTETTVEKINIPQESIDVFREINGRNPTQAERDDIASTLFDREETNRFEDALPRTKISASARYSENRFSLLGRVTYYGSIEYKPTNAANDETFGAKALLDLDFAYELWKGVRLSVGGNNVLNTFPDKHTKAANISDGNFPYSRRVTQFGINGGFYYGRLQFTM